MKNKDSNTDLVLARKRSRSAPGEVAAADLGRWPKTVALGSVRSAMSAAAFELS